MEPVRLERYLFTIFTPTYNRASTLHRVYGSLKAQTFRDFEWLLIDDGSTDNTREIVERWQNLADFPIRYIYQENSGKHVAHNLAVQQARGELFLPLDSDDECVPQALERFKFHWDRIPESERPEFAGVTTLCVDQYGKLIGDRFPQDVMDSSWMEIVYKHRIRGEKWGFTRMEILKQFPLPVVEGYRFYIPEALIWYAIGQKFRTRFVNEPLRTYWSDEIGRPDQVTSPQMPSRNAVGMSLLHQYILNKNIHWLCYAPEEFLRSAVHYARFSFHAGKGASGQLKQLDNALAKVLWATMLPIGVFAYWRDRQ